MKKQLKKWVQFILNVYREKSGFVSIETVIVAGLMITLGAFAITGFYTVGQDVVDNAIASFQKVLTIQPK